MQVFAILFIGFVVGYGSAIWAWIIHDLKKAKKIQEVS
jgi:hypothetical protein